jgi:RNA recognition motif-containing protein
MKRKDTAAEKMARRQGKVERPKTAEEGEPQGGEQTNEEASSWAIHNSGVREKSLLFGPSDDPWGGRMNIYVGNLAYSITEEDLKKAFEAFGEVASVNVIKDQYSSQSKGFGFVEMPESAEAQAAIAGLNGKDLNGRTLTVNEARPRPDKNRGGFGGKRGGGGGGRRY